jgi:ribosomal protein S18 acetylase RimI-like enzyme
VIAAAPSRAITIRSAGAGDQAFVAATFAEQLSRGNHRDANAIVDRILDSEATRVLIATEDHRIVGWLAYAAIPRVRAVLFAYVRNKARGQGIARELTDAAWPRRAGSWVHAGLRGGSTKALLERFNATAMSLEELL